MPSGLPLGGVGAVKIVVKKRKGVTKDPRLETLCSTKNAVEE